MSFFTTSSVNLRPMRRLTAATVFGGVGDGLALGGLPDQHFAVLGEGNDRRRRPIALAVLDDLGLAALHDRDAGIGRAEIDANHFSHDENPLENS